MPVLNVRPPWRETFASLKAPNYRKYAGMNLVAYTAVWMQRIAMDWLVLQLSGSVTAVGITVAMQFTPMLLFGLYGGILADRYPKQRILMVSQSGATLIAATLAVLTLTGSVQVWHIYVISFALGLVSVIDNPARQVFVNELVGPHNLRNAISLNSSIFQFGGLLGPAVGGILITAVGAGWSFAINAAACLTVVIVLSTMDRSKFHSNPPAPRGKGQLREGIAYVRSKPVIFWTITMIGVLAVFAFNMPVFLTAYANNVFDVGAKGYGLFNTLVATGALAGAIASTRRTSVRLSMLVVTAAVLGVVQATAGLAPNEFVFSVLLVGTGFMNLLFMTGASSLVQMSSNMQVRGRVISLYILVQLGGQAFGGPITGWIVERFGPHFAMVLSGAVPAMAAVVIALLIARGAHLRLKFSLRGVRPQVAVVTRVGKTLENL